LNDDNDIRREIRNLFMRTNMLVSRFCKCSTNVKLRLFKSYCISMYDLGLWEYFTITTFNKFRSCYNKCIKKFFGYNRLDSMSSVLMQLHLPIADTVLHNSRIMFHHQCVVSCSSIVQWFETVNVR